jgi:hypothetical protein
MAGAFLDRFNSRDTAGLLALYRPDAIYTFTGQDKAVGLEQIKAAMLGFSPVHSSCAAAT